MKKGYWAGWRVASTAMRLATPAACANPLLYSRTDLISPPRSPDHFSKRRAALAPRQPAGYRAKRNSGQHSTPRV